MPRGSEIAGPPEAFWYGAMPKCAFALAMWKKPHMLILDEPTNHLDIDAVNALIVALNNYTGGVIIVSHDQHLISTVCE